MKPPGSRAPEVRDTGQVFRFAPGARLVVNETACPVEETRHVLEETACPAEETRHVLNERTRPVEETRRVLEETARLVEKARRVLKETPYPERVRLALDGQLPARPVDAVEELHAHVRQLFAEDVAPREVLGGACLAALPNLRVDDGGIEPSIGEPLKA